MHTTVLRPSRRVAGSHQLHRTLYTSRDNLATTLSCITGLPRPQSFSTYPIRMHLSAKHYLYTSRECAPKARGKRDSKLARASSDPNSVRNLSTHDTGSSVTDVEPISSRTLFQQAVSASSFRYVCFRRSGNHHGRPPLFGCTTLCSLVCSFVVCRLRKVHECFLPSCVPILLVTVKYQN